jgi:uncharacterized membrane protein
MVDARTVALFFHLLGALVFVAGVVVAGAGFESARRRRRSDEIALLLGLTRFGVLLVAIGALMLGVFGLWLVHLDDLRLSTGWIAWAIALYIVAIALGGAGGRRPKRARELATRLAAAGAAVTDELRGLLEDRVSRAENYASLLLVLVIFALMVFKP